MRSPDRKATVPSLEMLVPSKDVTTSWGPSTCRVHARGWCRRMAQVKGVAKVKGTATSWGPRTCTGHVSEHQGQGWGIRLFWIYNARMVW